MQRVRSAATRAILPLLVSVFGTLFFVPATLAASDICCKCKAPGASTYTCLTDPSFTCAEIVAGSQNSSISGYTCDEASSAQCASISSNGLCTVGPSPAKTFNPAAGNPNAPQQIEAIVPTLNVAIPGLTFSKTIPLADNKLQIPFLAEYVSVVYTYLTGIAVIAAAVMIVYGGFKYILAATISGVKDGKEIVRNAIIGLFLIFGAYTMLNLVNPATTNLGSLTVEYITPINANLEGIQPTEYWKLVSTSGGSSVPSSLTDSNAPPPPPGTTVSSGSCELEINQAKVPTVESVYQCAIKVANDTGVDPCYVIVAINHESYLALPNLAGHDENVTAAVNPPKTPGGPRELIAARKKFLADGVTYKGQPVGPNTLNDDTIDYTREDLGFDKRYSHGGGVMGMTIPCIAGKCYSQRDRLDTYKGIEGPTLGIKEIITKTKGDPKDPAVVRKVWDAYHGVDPPGRTQETLRCFGQTNPLESILPTQFNICRGDFPLDSAGCASKIAELKAKGYPVPSGACTPLLGCQDKRMPITKENGVLKIREGIIVLPPK